MFLTVFTHISNVYFDFIILGSYSVCLGGMRVPFDLIFTCLWDSEVSWGW